MVDLFRRGRPGRGRSARGALAPFPQRAFSRAMKTGVVAARRVIVWCTHCLLPVLGVSIVSTNADVQNATFSAKVESVRVDVLVTDKGQPVHGLSAADFEILDEGVPQHVDLVSFDEIPLNVIFALDMSSSVAGERLDHLRAAS